MKPDPNKYLSDIAYDSTEDEIVWAIVKKHLPELEKEVKDQLKKSG